MPTCPDGWPCPNLLPQLEWPMKLPNVIAWVSSLEMVKVNGTSLNKHNAGCLKQTWGSSSSSLFRWGNWGPKKRRDFEVCQDCRSTSLWLKCSLLTSSLVYFLPYKKKFLAFPAPELAWSYVLICFLSAAAACFRMEGGNLCFRVVGSSCFHCLSCHRGPVNSSWFCPICQLNSKSTFLTQAPVITTTQGTQSLHRSQLSELEINASAAGRCWLQGRTQAIVFLLTVTRPYSSLVLTGPHLALSPSWGPW